MQNLDSSRLLLAEQLNGVARIMQNLSIGFDEKISSNRELEEEIISKLERAEIPCLEVVAYGEKGEISAVALLVRDNKVCQIIEDVLLECVGVKMQLVEEKFSDISGWKSLIFEPQSKFNVISGYSSLSKNENQVCGDCFTILQINQSKILLAISDGMGHGEKAHKNSELTINVVENFYKAGFENEIVLSSVNRLMSINQMEDFATLDMCVIDLEFGFVDFIKLGANPSYVKHKHSLTSIEGSSLPLGVVEEIKTKVQKSAIEEGDIIILCSDGVADAFNGEENLKDLINNLQLTAPKELANEISKEAVKVSKGDLKDDMTIIVARIVRLN
jgi:stage II sporulation protein E